MMWDLQLLPAEVVRDRAETEGGRRKPNPALDADRRAPRAVRTDAHGADATA